LQTNTFLASNALKYGHKTIRIILLIILAVFIAHMITANWHELKDSFQFSAYAFLGITILHLIFLLVSARRLHLVILSSHTSHISFSYWFRVFIEGRLLNKIFPQLGNIYRGVDLKYTQGFTYLQYSGSYVFFTWFDTITNILFYLFIIIFFSNEISSTTMLIAVMAVILLFIAPLILQKISTVPAITRITSTSNLLNKVSGLKSIIKSFKSIRLLSSLLILGVISFILMATRIYLGFYSFGISLNLADIALIYVIYKISILVVITPGNFGIQEFSLGALSELFGYGFSTGIAAALLLRFYGYILFLMLLLFFQLNTVKRFHSP